MVWVVKSILQKIQTCFNNSGTKYFLGTIVNFVVLLIAMQDQLSLPFLIFYLSGLYASYLSAGEWAGEDTRWFAKDFQISERKSLLLSVDQTEFDSYKL